jgi:hypothetical protein
VKGTRRSYGPRDATLETVTSEERENLAHPRRARDLMDREYMRPLDVDAIARAAPMSPASLLAAVPWRRVPSTAARTAASRAGT